MGKAWPFTLGNGWRILTGEAQRLMQPWTEYGHAAGGMFRPVQILPNLHKRLAAVVEDFGPRWVDGERERFLYPGYLFLGCGREHKPPGWFWGMTGVVRVFPIRVGVDELARSKSEFERLRLERMMAMTVADKPKAGLKVMDRAVIQLLDVEGNCIARVNLFGRDLEMKVA